RRPLLVDELQLGPRPPLHGDARRRPRSLHADAGPADGESARGFRDADRRRPATAPRRGEHGAHSRLPGEMLAGGLPRLSDDPTGRERYRQSPALDAQALSLRTPTFGRTPAPAYPRSGGSSSAAHVGRCSAFRSLRAAAPTRASRPPRVSSRHGPPHGRPATSPRGRAGRPRPLRTSGRGTRPPPV